MIGEQIGHYRIRKRIGGGGMGDVYLAAEQKPHFTRQVVLKLVKDDLSDESKLRFLDEMRILANLEHENIARMYDGGSENGRLYIARGYLRNGVNLRDFSSQKARKRSSKS
jgi:serine/threonine protein kinase